MRTSSKYRDLGVTSVQSEISTYDPGRCAFGSAMVAEREVYNERGEMIRRLVMNERGKLATAFRYHPELRLTTIMDYCAAAQGLMNLTIQRDIPTENRTTLYDFDRDPKTGQLALTHKVETWYNDGGLPIRRFWLNMSSGKSCEEVFPSEELQEPKDRPCLSETRKGTLIERRYAKEVHRLTLDHHERITSTEISTLDGAFICKSATTYDDRGLVTERIRFADFDRPSVRVSYTYT